MKTIKGFWIIFVALTSFVLATASLSIAQEQELTADFIATELANDTNGVMFDCSSFFSFEAGCFRLETTTSIARRMLEIEIANYSDLEWDTPWVEVSEGDNPPAYFRTLLVNTGKTFQTIIMEMGDLDQMVVVGDVVLLDE